MEYISTYALFHLENLPSMKIKKKTNFMPLQYAKY